MQDGPYNDVARWQYHCLPQVFGGGRAYDIHTETELDQALAAAVSDTQGYCLLEVHLDPGDRSPALQRLAERLARRL